jgi:hypothetical protein
LKKEAKTTLTYQSVDRMKQTGQSVTPKMTIQDPGLTNQKLNVITVKRHPTISANLMLGIARFQPRGLRIMKIL